MSTHAFGPVTAGYMHLEAITPTQDGGPAARIGEGKCTELEEKGGPAACENLRCPLQAGTSALQRISPATAFRAIPVVSGTDRRSPDLGRKGQWARPTHAHRVTEPMECSAFHEHRASQTPTPAMRV